MRGDTRNHVLQDPYVDVVFWGPMNGSLNPQSSAEPGCRPTAAHAAACRQFRASKFELSGSCACKYVGTERLAYRYMGTAETKEPCIYAPDKED